MIGWRRDGGRWRSLASLGFKPVLGFLHPCFEAVGAAEGGESAQWKPGFGSKSRGIEKN